MLSSPAQPVPRGMLQLVAVACLSLAAKQEEVGPVCRGLSASVRSWLPAPCALLRHAGPLCLPRLQVDQPSAVEWADISDNCFTVMVATVQSRAACQGQLQRIPGRRQPQAQQSEARFTDPHRSLHVRSVTISCAWSGL